MAIGRVLECKVVTKDVIMCHRVGIDSRWEIENRVLVVTTIDINLTIDTLLKMASQRRRQVTLFFEERRVGSHVPRCAWEPGVVCGAEKT